MPIDPNQIFQGATQAAFNIGQRLPSPKSFDASKFGNLNNQFPTSMSTPQFSPKSLSQLGAITTEYGGSTRYEKFHPALDVANKIGTPIPALASGKVVAIETGRKQGDKGYGNFVIIQDAQGNNWRYSHLNNTYVKVGSQIAKGMTIGEMGNTGSTYSNSGGTGSHLDLRIVDAYNRYVNPWKLLGQNT